MALDSESHTLESRLQWVGEHRFLLEPAWGPRGEVVRGQLGKEPEPVYEIPVACAVGPWPFKGRIISTT